MQFTIGRNAARRVSRLIPLAGVALAAAGALAFSATASASSFVQQAKKIVAADSGPQTKWTGPTSGPKTQPGKTIVYIEADANLALGVDWGTAMKQAAAKVGWHLKIINGQGTTAGWTAAFSQALALHPDGIALSADITSLKKQTAQAAKKGIPIIGLEAIPHPGPDPALHVYTDISQNPTTLAHVMIDYAVAKSDGKARVMLVYDNEYATAQLRDNAWKGELKKCSGCTLLANLSSPFSQATTLMPALMTSSLSKYGKDFWPVAVDDGYWDYAVPALRSAGVAPSGAVHLLAADGSATAYTRIRSGQYQEITLPAPAEEQGYQAIDEFNRAFHHLKPSGFEAPPYIVDKSNVNKYGGNHAVFNPANNFVGHYTKIWGVK